LRSIQGKMVIIYILLVLVAMEIIGVQLVRRLESYYETNFRTTLETQANLLAGFALRYFSGDETESYLGDLVDDFRLQTGAQIVVVDAAGMVLAATGEGSSQVGKRFQQHEFTRALAGVTASEIRHAGTAGERILYLAVPVQRENQTVGAVGLSSSLVEVDKTLNEIKGILLKATTVALLATVLLGFALARTITQPIQEVTRQAAAIAEGDFGQPVRVYSKDEIGQLAAGFNFLRERLQQTLSEISSGKEKVETILANLNDGVLALDPDGNVLHINPAARNLLRLREPSSNILGRPWDEVFPKLGLAEELKKVQQGVATTSRLEGVLAGERVLRVHLAPFKSSSNLAGVVITLQDITEQEKLESMRREFVANVSHELRTPLTTIKSYIETMLDAEESLDEATSRRFLKVAVSEVDRMTRLVRDLLQLAQLDAGRMRFDKRPLDLAQLLHEVAERFSMQIQQRDLQLTLEIAPHQPRALADRDQIEQVLANLISNAIKFTASGGRINLGLSQRGAFLTVTVRDSGVGIPAEDQPRIFERFYRVDKARSRALGGTGLGLSIARQIVEAHGGEIRLESTPGEGTKVSFTLPIVTEEGGGVVV
jgi:two-component system sensor histidine kinase VicK